MPGGLALASLVCFRFESHNASNAIITILKGPKQTTHIVETGKENPTQKEYGLKMTEELALMREQSYFNDLSTTFRGHSMPAHES